MAYKAENNYYHYQALYRKSWLAPVLYIAEKAAQKVPPPCHMKYTFFHDVHQLFWDLFLPRSYKDQRTWLLLLLLVPSNRLLNFSYIGNKNTS